MTTPIPDWNNVLWRYTGPVGNAILALWLANYGYQMAAAATSYFYKSTCDFKACSNPKSSADSAGSNVAKALQESDAQAGFVSREANFTLSSQWTPKGYIIRDSKIISYAPGLTYSSKVRFRVRYEALDYTFSLEGKKDKDKDKKDSTNYKKLSTAVKGAFKDLTPEELSTLEPEPKEGKEPKQALKVRVLQNAAIDQGDGGAKVGWGTKLDITNEVVYGRDKDSLGGYFCEFKITWKESTTTTTFQDTVRIKCYTSGEVTFSPNFSKACEKADKVKADLALPALSPPPSGLGAPSSSTMREKSSGRSDEEVLTLILDDEEPRDTRSQNPIIISSSSSKDVEGPSSRQQGHVEQGPPDENTQLITQRKKDKGKKDNEV